MTPFEVFNPLSGEHQADPYGAYEDLVRRGPLHRTRLGLWLVSGHALATDVLKNRAFRTDYEKTLAVTAEDVKRVANKYLTEGRVVLSVVPLGKLDQAAKPDASTRVTDYDTKKPEGGK